MIMARMPDVIGIGTRRCGSSWVHQALNTHDEIGKPPNGLHFFSDNFGKGREWYAGELAPFAERPVLLEFSVSYLYPEHYLDVAERIAALAPDARLFVCVRDPVSRAFSDYLRSIRNAEYPADMSFEAAIERDPVLVERGRFGRLLRPFFDGWGPDRLKVLFYDDLESDRRAYISELTDYVGASRPVPDKAFERNEPKGKTVRFETLNQAVRGAKHLADGLADRLGLADGWGNWKARHMVTYERMLELNHKQAAIEARTERRLRSELSSDIAELEAMTGRDLSAWRGR
jgi:hypothetical protein